MAIIENIYNIGLNISEEEYRELPYPSYSYFSDLEKVGLDPGLLGDSSAKNISDLDGIIYGKLVDNLLLENKEPEDFVIIAKKPTGKPKQILQALKHNIDYLPNKDIFHKDNENLIMACCDALKYYNTTNKRDYSKRIKALKNYEEYYKKYDPNKTIISRYLYDSALRAVNTLSHLDIFQDEDLEVIPQIKLLGSISGMKVKGMLDIVVIDHKNKTITPMDLKTGSTSVDSFIASGYIGWNYYIQSKLYSKLLFEELLKLKKFEGYAFGTFKFIYYNRLKSDWIIFDSKDRFLELSTPTLVLNNTKCIQSVDLTRSEYAFTVIDDLGSAFPHNKPTISKLITTLKKYLIQNPLHKYYNAVETKRKE